VPATLTRRALLAAGATFALAGCAPAASPNARLRAPITYVAIGASDAVGVGVERPERDGWVPQLARLLPQPTRLVNLGIPGIKLREAASVELPPALEAAPDLVTVWLAVNDVLGRVSLDQYRADLEGMLRDLRSGTRGIVAVANVPDAPDAGRFLGLAAEERRALSAAWNGAIAETVARNGALLVDLYATWPTRTHPEYIGPDGLHPSATGYRALAETFHAALRSGGVV
jgi:lysophospholipase L1-like esterase